MTNYKEILNAKTGEKEFVFNATLLNIGGKILENSNSKEFKIVTIGFNLPDGEEVERTAMCYSSNYEKGIEVGKDYLCNLSFDGEGNPHLRMSHLNNADRATVEDFAGLHQLKEQVVSEEFVM